MQKRFEYPAVLFVGAGGYSLIEILWRGYTHWTMALTGGICFLLIYLADGAWHGETMWKRCLVGSLAITLTELWVGFFVNILLGWDVWDYSRLFFNVGGQICLLYSALWFLLCVPLYAFCPVLRRLIGPERALPR